MLLWSCPLVACRGTTGCCVYLKEDKNRLSFVTPYRTTKLSFLDPRSVEHLDGICLRWFSDGHHQHAGLHGHAEPRNQVRCPAGERALLGRGLPGPWACTIVMSSIRDRPTGPASTSSTAPNPSTPARVPSPASPTRGRGHPAPSPSPSPAPAAARLPGPPAPVRGPGAAAPEGFGFCRVPEDQEQPAARGERQETGEAPSGDRGET